MIASFCMDVLFVGINIGSVSTWVCCICAFCHIFTVNILKDFSNGSSSLHHSFLVLAFLFYEPSQNLFRSVFILCIIYYCCIV